MTHRFTPDSSGTMVTSQVNSISLDLSSCNKIVIHPRSMAKQKSTPLQTQSIFKNAKDRPSGSSSAKDTSYSVTQPVMGGKSAPNPRQQVPFPRPQDNDWEAKKLAKLAQVRQATGRIEKRSLPQAVSSGSVAPVIPTPRPQYQSPYVDEYARCGCTQHGGNPCRRCQLMLLSDRFCDLVNLQCEKWNAP